MQNATFKAWEKDRDLVSLLWKCGEKTSFTTQNASRDSGFNVLRPPFNNLPKHMLNFNHQIPFAQC